MKTAIITFRFKPEMLEEGARYWNETLKEIFKVRGFKGGCLVVDRKSGDGYSFGFWESAEEAAQFRNSEHYTRLLAKLQPLVTEPPVRKLYDVVGGSLPSLEVATEKAA